jgi:hypothetical protein
MEGRNIRSDDASPIFDTLDVDLVVKVLAHTAFGKVMFTRRPNAKRKFMFIQVHFSCSLFLFSTSFRVLKSLILWSCGLLGIS